MDNTANRNHQASSEPIEPLFNEAFIRIFGREESKKLTRSLVNTVLESAGIGPIGEIEQISAEHGSPEGGVECKTPRFDVHIVSENRLVDLEAQRFPAEVGNRSVYYAANALVAGTGKVRSYSELPQAIVITLLDDPALFPESQGFVHVCRWFWGVDGALIEATDRQLLVLVELSKIHERYNELGDDVLRDKLLSWAYLITNGFRNESEVRAIMDSYPDIEDFAELYGLAVNDPKVMQAYWDAKTAVLEYNNRQEYFAKLEREAKERGLEQGIEQGIERGIEQGIKQGVDSLSAKLRDLGVSESIIAEAVESVREEAAHRE